MQKAETVNYHSREQITELTLNCTKKFITSKFIAVQVLGLKILYTKITTRFAKIFWTILVLLNL